MTTSVKLNSQDVEASQVDSATRASKPSNSELEFSNSNSNNAKSPVTASNKSILIDQEPQYHHNHPTSGAILDDSEEEDEFIKKYGEIEFQYIKRPKDSIWFIRPHALNYFEDGVLFRTKGERTSGRTELFLDLLYVGIVANLAGNATEHASASSFLMYCLLFIPSWTVWSDIKDFMNYYYNEDLTQKLYIMWIIVLLVFYVSNDKFVLDSRSEAALTIVPYILCRLSLSVSLLVYSLYIPQHRPQMRIYAVSIMISCCIWIPVIFIPTRAKVGVAIANIFLENISFIVSYHPLLKKMLKLRQSTALNIEHEIERFQAFFIIALGEFLYKAVATNEFGGGFHSKIGRGICLTIISYTFLWIYSNAGTSVKATHPLRYSAWTAVAWMYAHIPLIGGLILAADAGGELAVLDNTSTKKHQELEEGEPSMYVISLFFTGGICISLLSIAILGFIERPKDPKGMHVIPHFFRIFPRIPIAAIILCLSFAEMGSSALMGLTTMLLVILLLWESITMTPRRNLSYVKRHCDELNAREEVRT